MGKIEAGRDHDDAEVDLAGVTLLDARGGEPVDLGAEPPLALLNVIRHRH